MIIAALAILAMWLVADWTVKPYGLYSRRAIDPIVGLVFRSFKWILRLPKKHQELTQLARTQEDKEIEVIIQELDKELAERNS